MRPMSRDQALSIETKQARSSGHYRVNEFFYSLQGEGRLAGTPMVFVRFSDCNLRCTLASAGFDCDTHFLSGEIHSTDSIVREARSLSPSCPWVLLTGGEPALQVDPPLLYALHHAGFKTAIETNGTIELPSGIDWICVSPKSPYETLRQPSCDELKFVLRDGDDLPKCPLPAKHRLISPVFGPDGTVDPEDLAHCIDLVKDSPDWALSLQLHKIIGVR